MKGQEISLNLGNIHLVYLSGLPVFPPGDSAERPEVQYLPVDHSTQNQSETYGTCRPRYVRHLGSGTESERVPEFDIRHIAVVLREILTSVSTKCPVGLVKL